ncbi:hypothetical protein A9Q84_10740 [Halobacteriovorax marinus]|uniref:YCII-related domain-containing protein n=1 Tax=Halobacteriovorax marinus TaxID=97084 RepID=A0A1Y5FCX8_9BACT|nr:hypothetical protein A9Q84_10740 [Halobacteriovorax marinus]
MTEFVFTYHGGQKPSTPEEASESMKKWQLWAARLGDALINPGHMAMDTIVLGENDSKNQPSSNPISGFSIIKAENKEAALELLKSCPHLVHGGTLEVSELIKMD